MVPTKQFIKFLSFHLCFLSCFLLAVHANAEKFYLDAEEGGLYSDHKLIREPPVMLPGHGLNMNLFHYDIYAPHLRYLYFKAKASLLSDIETNRLRLSLYMASSKFADGITGPPSRTRNIYAKVFIINGSSEKELCSFSFQTNTQIIQLVSKEVQIEKVTIPRGATVELRMWSDIMANDTDTVALETRYGQYNSIELLKAQSIQTNPGVLLLLDGG